MPDRTQGGACLFGPKQHAVMFGLLAREICRHFGPDADPLLLRAVETYGEERRLPDPFQTYLIDPGGLMAAGVNLF